MKQFYQFVFLIICMNFTISDAQIFKHLRRGAPGAKRDTLSNSNYMQSTSDTMGNIYLLIVDSSSFKEVNYSVVSSKLTCHVEIWNGTLWIKTASVTLFNRKENSTDYIRDPYINSMVIYDGQVVLAGLFDSSSNNLGRGVVAWDGSQWQSIGNGLFMGYRYKQNIYNHRCWVNNAFLFKGQLHIAGNFDSVPGKSVHGCARLNSNNQWDYFGGSATNRPFQYYWYDSVKFMQIVPPIIKVADDSLYFFSAYAFKTYSNGYQGSFEFTTKESQSKQWVFADSMGQKLYASDGLNHRPVSVPNGFIIRGLFKHKGQLHLLGHTDSGMNIRMIARRDSSGIWHISTLPQGDSIPFNFSDNPIYDPIDKTNGNVLFAGKLTRQSPKDNTVIRFFEYDGKSVTGNDRIIEGDIYSYNVRYNDYNVYKILQSGKQYFLVGSFMHLTDFNTRVTDSFFRFAAEIKLKKTMLIKGKAFVDWNLDEVWQSYEPVLKNKIVYWKDSGYVCNTDNQGNYMLYIPAGSNRKIEINTNQYYVSAWSGSKIYSSNKDTVIVSNFPFDVTLDRDLALELIPYTGIKARRGAESKYMLRVSNISGKPVKSATLRLNLNKGIRKFVAIGSSPTYDSVRLMAEWKFNTTLQADSSFNLYFKCLYSADSFQYGDTVYTEARIVNSFSDADTSNNYVRVLQKISSAYDPNMKESNPRGEQIKQPDAIQFTIHFQNEGNDTAYRVVVVDTLSMIMPMYEIEIGAASHPFNFTVENNIMVWEFDKIMLPNKSEDELGSCGFLSFKAKLNKPLKVGDSVRNRAGIYFDYEKPVMTNYASILMVKDNQNDLTVNTSGESLIKVYPNPSSGFVTVHNASKEKVKIKMYSMDGKLVREFELEAGSDEVIDLFDASQGIYYLVTDQGETIALVKQK